MPFSLIDINLYGVKEISKAHVSAFSDLYKIYII